MFVGTFSNFKGNVTRLLQWPLHCIMSDEDISIYKNQGHYVHKVTLAGMISQLVAVVAA